MDASEAVPAQDPLTDPVPEEFAGSPADDDTMITAMRSYKGAKAEHNQRKERAAAYLAQIEEEIKRTSPPARSTLSGCAPLCSRSSPSTTLGRSSQCRGSAP